MFVIFITAHTFQTIETEAKSIRNRIRAIYLAFLRTVELLCLFSVIDLQLDLVLKICELFVAAPPTGKA